MDKETQTNPPPFCLRFMAYQDEPSLLQFLQSRLAQNHRESLPELLETGCIAVQESIVLTDLPLTAAASVEVTLPSHFEGKVDTRWRVLWENDELLAVYKPHVLPVSRTSRNLYNTLISLVQRQTQYNQAQLLHRLDAETAGIILLAKNAAADRKWKPRLKELLRRKVYHAWVYGTPEWQERVVECELAEKIGSPIRSQMYVVDENTPDLYPKPKYSKTHFKVLRSEGDRTLVECELFTGRKHQIRAHLAYLGHPIVGDKIYAHAGRYYLKRLNVPLDQNDFERLGARYQMLCACQLDIKAKDESAELNLSAIAWDLAEPGGSTRELT